MSRHFPPTIDLNTWLNKCGVAQTKKTKLMLFGITRTTAAFTSFVAVLPMPTIFLPVEDL